jgi:hypothetical protein
MHSAMPLQCRPPDQDLIKESDDITHCAGIETDVTLATPAVLEREREREMENMHGPNQKLLPFSLLRAGLRPITW